MHLFAKLKTNRISLCKYYNNFIAFGKYFNNLSQ